MIENKILNIIEDCGIEISPLYMKGPVGLVAKKEKLGITYQAVEASVLQFNDETDLRVKCQELKNQKIVCFKPYIVAENSIRGAFLPYHEISQMELVGIIKDLSQFYELGT